MPSGGTPVGVTGVTVSPVALAAVTRHVCGSQVGWVVGPSTRAGGDVICGRGSWQSAEPAQSVVAGEDFFADATATWAISHLLWLPLCCFPPRASRAGSDDSTATETWPLECHATRPLVEWFAVAGGMAREHFAQEPSSSTGRSQAHTGACCARASSSLARRL